MVMYTVYHLAVLCECNGKHNITHTFRAVVRKLDAQSQAKPTTDARTGAEKNGN